MLFWNQLDRKIVLASQSPRRKKILESMGMVFSVCAPKIKDENDFLCKKNIATSIRTLAHAKANSIAGNFSSSLILGCDTIVVLNSQIIGKPKDRADAKQILKLLSGKCHVVYSGISGICTELQFKRSLSARTTVFFRDISDREIDQYLDHENYIDKAGAYAIQGRAMSFVNKINGCFYNVMGLPISETIDICKSYVNHVKGLK